MHVGEVLEGKFRVERVVGEGAMGLVAEAMHLDLEERVALKFLNDEAKARPDLTARFAREARAAATIKNDHVARVYDVGMHDGAPFIVMELLVGEDLEHHLVRNGPVDSTTAADFVVQACEGLTAAHARGIVHRDIKPGNLFLVEHAGLRDVKIVDFGISKAGLKKGSLEDAELVAGDTTQIMGSPHYMSPEQIRSTRNVDARADVWSLGVVLYELVTGRTPFEAIEITAIIAQVLHEPHRPASSLVPDLPQGFEAVIDRCLEKDITKRYQTAADLAQALVPFAPKRSRAIADRASSMIALATGGEAAVDSLPPPALVPAGGGHASGTRLPSFAAPEPAPKRSFLAPALGLTAGALVLGLAALAFTFVTLKKDIPARAEPHESPAAAPPTSVAANTPTEVAADPARSAAGMLPGATSTPATAPSTTPAGASSTAPAARPVAVPAPHPRPRPPASTSAPTPPTPDNDIRHER